MNKGLLFEAAPYLLTYYQNRLIQFTSIYITRNSRVKPR